MAGVQAVSADLAGEDRRVGASMGNHKDETSTHAPAEGVHVSDDIVVTRELPAESSLVRGVLHELAQTGTWSGLADAATSPVTLHVSDAGAGASVLEVRQPVASGETADDVRAALLRELAELERRLVERTTDAS